MEKTADGHGAGGGGVICGQAQPRRQDGQPQDDQDNGRQDGRDRGQGGQQAHGRRGHRAARHHEDRSHDPSPEQGHAFPLPTVQWVIFRHNIHDQLLKPFVTARPDFERQVQQEGMGQPVQEEVSHHPANSLSCSGHVIGWDTLGKYGVRIHGGADARTGLFRVVAEGRGFYDVVGPQVQRLLLEGFHQPESEDADKEDTGAQERLRAQQEGSHQDA